MKQYKNGRSSAYKLIGSIAAILFVLLVVSVILVVFFLKRNGVHFIDTYFQINI